MLVDAATGTISGVPTAAGQTSVKLTSTNVGGTGTATLELTVKAGILAGSPEITSAPTASGKAGEPFTYRITATNGPTIFAATGLPPGLSVDGAGLISGTPMIGGTFTVKLSAGNAVATNSATLSVTIAGKTPVVTLTAKLPIADAKSGTPRSFLLRRSGDTGKPLTVSYTNKGSTQNGVDYEKLSTTTTFKAGSATKQIKIIPLHPAGVTGQKTVILRLKASPAYIIGTKHKVKVTIDYGQ